MIQKKDLALVVLALAFVASTASQAAALSPNKARYVHTEWNSVVIMGRDGWGHRFSNGSVWPNEYILVRSISNWAVPHSRSNHELNPAAWAIVQDWLQGTP
ncbi:MAG: hypothetical protein K1X67_00330 [Fimbriimonadaceae bacterium]|nr:hypothetical protein [Fimbriimonadaceae bacterium]